jgi:hypothetical protein
MSLRDKPVINWPSKGAEMETRDLDRIRFITRHFNDLQGLRYGVPLGLITLSLGGTTLLRTASFLGAFLLLLGAKRYYRNTFGEVERPQVEPAGELYPVSIFSPAGPIPRLEGSQPVPTVARHFLITLVLAMALFSYFQALPPNIVVNGDESLGQHPQVIPEPAPIFGEPWIGGYPNGNVMRSPSMIRAVFAQMVYVLYGSFLLGVWLWRERRRSQSHYLALAILLLGLAAVGTSLGFLARADGEIARNIDLLLPALVYPGVAALLCGSSMVLAGLLDHWQLVRTFGRPAARMEV